MSSFLRVCKKHLFPPSYQSLTFALVLLRNCSWLLESYPKARVTSTHPSTFVLLPYHEMHMDTVFFSESFVGVKNNNSGHP